MVKRKYVFASAVSHDVFIVVGRRECNDEDDATNKIIIIITVDGRIGGGDE